MISSSELAGMGIDSGNESAAKFCKSDSRLKQAALPEIEGTRPIRKGRNSGAKTTRIVINIGRNRRIAPNFILGALVSYGNDGQGLRQDRHHDEHTTVEVPEAECDYIIESSDSMKINGNKVEEVKLYKGSPFSDRAGSDRRGDSKPRFDRKKSAYGNRKKSDIYSDYIPNRKKRTKKRH